VNLERATKRVSTSDKQGSKSKMFFPDYSVFAFGVEGFTPRTSIEKIEDFSQWLSAPFMLFRENPSQLKISFSCCSRFLFSML
jgi:hypothetical protein